MIVSIDRVCRLLELLHVIDICDWSVLAPGVDARTQAGNTTATAKNVGLSLKLTLDRPQPAGRIPSLQQSGRHISDISNSKNDLVLTVRADLASWQRTR